MYFLLFDDRFIMAAIRSNKDQMAGHHGGDYTKHVFLSFTNTYLAVLKHLFTICFFHWQIFDYSEGLVHNFSDFVFSRIEALISVW